MSDHLGPVRLAELFGDLRGEASSAVEHLLGCERCRKGAVAGLRELRAERARKALRSDAGPSTYDAIWGRLAESAASVSAERRRLLAEAEPRVRELMAAPPPHRHRLALGDSRLRSWEVVELLLEEARGKPDHREESLRLALEIADRLSLKHEEPGRATDLRGALRAELGDNQREKGDLVSAEAELAEAARLLEGSDDVAERGRLCRFAAALRREQKRTDEALGLLDRAADLFEELGDSAGQALALVELGELAQREADLRRAQAAFDGALALGRRGLAGNLALRAVRGAATCFALDGRLEDARETLELGLGLFGWRKGSPEAVALRAIEGQFGPARLSENAPPRTTE